jgi:hypothetical protein
MQKIFGNKILVEKLYESNALGAKEYKHRVKVLDVGNMVVNKDIKVGNILLVTGETDFQELTWVTEGQIVGWC